MTAAEKQDAIVERIHALGDCFEQYSYLLLLAGRHPSLPEALRTEKNIVRGCQSLVWVIVRREDGVLRVQADSDTLIIKGVLSLLTEIADGAPCAEIAALPFDLFDRLDLGLVFESTRLTGIRSIWDTIRAAALEG
ncbi:MAG: SufE family protein [Oscillospiraceae bacterium]